MKILMLAGGVLMFYGWFWDKPKTLIAGLAVSLLWLSLGVVTFLF